MSKLGLKKRRGVFLIPKPSKTPKASVEVPILVTAYRSYPLNAFTSTFKNQQIQIQYRTHTKNYPPAMCNHNKHDDIKIYRAQQLNQSLPQNVKSTAKPKRYRKRTSQRKRKTERGASCEAHIRQAVIKISLITLSLDNWVPCLCSDFETSTCTAPNAEENVS